MDDITLHVMREKDGRPARCDAVRSSADGSDFLSAASTRLDAAKTVPSAAHAAAAAFSPCPAAGGASALSCSTRSDGGFAEVGERNEDVICPLCELCDDDLRAGPDGTSVGSREVMMCEGCQGRFHVA